MERPTSVLSPIDVEDFKIINGLRDKGRTMIFVAGFQRAVQGLSGAGGI